MTTTDALRRVRGTLLPIGLSAILACSLPSAPQNPKVVAQNPGQDGGGDYASFDAVGQRVLVSLSYGMMPIDVDTGKT